MLDNVLRKQFHSGGKIGIFNFIKLTLILCTKYPILFYYVIAFVFVPALVADLAAAVFVVGRFAFRVSSLD